VNVIEGKLSGASRKVAIVSSRFNDFICSKLIEGARDCLVRHGAADNDITLVRVPGAFEIAIAVKKVVDSGKFDAVICVGAIIRGETSHYDHLASEVTKGIASIALDAPIPVVYGVVTTENVEQAVDRAGGKAGNRGWDAAMTALEVIDLHKQKF
jgi:6,7-dimethyl-8-ribityllumazine synthase